MFERFKKNKIADLTDGVQVDDILLRALLQGGTISREQAMSIPQVSADVGFVSDTFALIPVRLYKRVISGDTVKVTEIDDYRVTMINDDTKDALNGFEFKKALCQDFILDGAGYAFINNDKNRTKSLNYVKNSSISILESNMDPIFKQQKINCNAHEYDTFRWIKLLRNTRDGASGVGIVIEISSALRTMFATLQYQLQLFEKGGNKKGFLKSKHKLNQDAIDQLKAAWSNLYSNNSENVVVLNDGIEFQESSNTSVEMQMNEARKTLDGEIDNLFHISKDYNETIKKAIMPIGKAFTTALNRDLLLEKEKGSYFFDLDYSELLKASQKERFQSYSMAKSAGWITKNEIRQKENMETIEGLDTVDVGLGAALYNIKDGTYYVPNTDTTRPKKGGSNE